MLVMYVAALVRGDVNRSRLAGESPRATGRSNLNCRIKCPEYSSLRAGKGDNHSQQDRNGKEKRIKGAMRGKAPSHAGQEQEGRKKQLKPRLGRRPEACMFLSVRSAIA
jgi:hypothetical protein